MFSSFLHWREKSVIYPGQAATTVQLSRLLSAQVVPGAECLFAVVSVFPPAPLLVLVAEVLPVSW